MKVKQWLLEKRVHRYRERRTYRKYEVVKRHNLFLWIDEKPMKNGYLIKLLTNLADGDQSSMSVRNTVRRLIKF